MIKFNVEIKVTEIDTDKIKDGIENRSYEFRELSLRQYEKMVEGITGAIDGKI